MKYFFFGILFLNLSLAYSQTNFEQKTEAWIDSSFEAKGVNWEQIRSQFLVFSKTNFSKTTTVTDFLDAWIETASQKRGKTQQLITVDFDTLITFTLNVHELLTQVEHHMLLLLQADTDWCRLNNQKSTWLSIRYINYYQPENFNGYSLASRLKGLEGLIESKSLYEKLVILFLSQNIFSKNTPKSFEEIASQSRKKFNECEINNPNNQSKDSTYETTADETEPCFLGGEMGMLKYIHEMIQYPELSREMAEQGTVYVQFVVNADGSISDICVIKSPALLLSQEAVRVISSMPQWSPGYQNGQAVRVRYTIPIRFSIG